MLPDAFFLPDGDALVPTWATRGPWDARFQHGGPPSALLATAMLEEAGPGVRLARLTTDFLRPVPLAPLRVKVAVDRAGRTVSRFTATLRADRPVMRAQGLFIRAAERPSSPPAAGAWSPAPWPDPDTCAPFVFPFFRWDEGYHRAIALRLAGGTWGRTPVRFWAQPRLPLVAGRPTAPEARVILLADAESGLGPPLDPEAWAYANPDLTVAFGRTPAAEGWLGFDVRSTSGGSGAGLSGSAIRDAAGPVAQSVQTLVVDPRG